MAWRNEWKIIQENSTSNVLLLSCRLRLSFFRHTHEQDATASSRTKDEELDINYVAFIKKACYNSQGEWAATQKNPL